MTKHIRKLMLRENFLWPRELNFVEVGEKGYCFSTEDGWSIDSGKDDVVVSCNNWKGLGYHYSYRFPWASVAWVSDKFNM